MKVNTMMQRSNSMPTMTTLRAFRMVLTAAAVSIGIAASAQPVSQGAASAEPPPKPISQAERLMFMSAHLKDAHPPVVLKYDYRKTGSLEEPYTDAVTVALDRDAAGGCCSSKGTFLTGAHNFPVPETDVDNAKGNQVILYFLEHDIADMHRLTSGAKVHFQRQIRRTLVDDATVTDSAFSYRGKFVNGKKISFMPYAHDPLRPKFEKFAKKHYVFMLSDAVPGGVVGMRAQIDGESDASPPLIVEELFLQGADGTEAKMTSNP